MRITTDVNYAGMRTAGNVSTRILPATGSISQINQLNNDVTAKLQRDRAMIDALTIAQSSRVLVQKAMDISARLMAIANQAMTTGSVNTEQLSTEMAGIQGTMQTYGEIVQVPVSGSRGGGDVYEQIHDRMTDVASGAGRLAAGENVDPGFFSSAGKAMTGLVRGITTDSDMISSSLGVRIKDVATPGGNSSVTDVAGMIRNNPELSLTAQANINSETVRNVLT